MIAPVRFRWYSKYDHLGAWGGRTGPEIELEKAKKK